MKCPNSWSIISNDKLNKKLRKLDNYVHLFVIAEERSNLILLLI
jgi:hypothetical protein